MTSLNMCHAAEYTRAATAVRPPAAGASLDISAYFSNSTVYQVTSLAARSSGRFVDDSVYSNCLNWTANTYMSGSTTYDTNGTAIAPSGFTSAPCKNPRPVACCL